MVVIVFVAELESNPIHRGEGGGGNWCMLVVEPSDGLRRVE